MQIQYNITRLEEWCKSNDLSEGTLSMESLMQATKLLQLKKVRLFPNQSTSRMTDRSYVMSSPPQATAADIDILFDVCWILSPTQIQKLISQYHVAEYEVRADVSYASSWTMIDASKHTDSHRARDPKDRLGPNQYQRQGGSFAPSTRV